MVGAGPTRLPRRRHSGSWDSVFRNRLGLTDRAALAAAEADLSLARVDQLKRRRLPGQYDLDHLRAFHWTIFQDV